MEHFFTNCVCQIAATLVSPQQVLDAQNQYSECTELLCFAEPHAQASHLAFEHDNNNSTAVRDMRFGMLMMSMLVSCALVTLRNKFHGGAVKSINNFKAAGR